MTKLFLSLDDAVKVAVREFDIDSVLARQEFMQKCYVTDNQYIIGYHDGNSLVLQKIMYWYLLEMLLEVLRRIRDDKRRGNKGIKTV